MATPDAAADALSAIDQALSANRIDAAVSLARQAAAQGIEHPLILNLVAFDLENQDRFGEALSRLDRALQLEPENVLTLCAIGQCLSKQGRAAEAIQAFEAAISLLPGHAPAHHGRGAAQAALGDLDGAHQSETLAARLDPQYPDPPGALAELALQRGELDVAREYARTALALDPFQPIATYVMANLAARDGQSEQAVKLLGELRRRGGQTPLHASISLRLMADELEKLGRFDEAWEAYDLANKAARSLTAEGFAATQVETSAPMCARLLREFKVAPAGRFGPVSPEAQSPVVGHVFLVGFVRSGTTLLEQVLASHPDVVALEERPTLRALTGDYFGEDGGLERLMAMGEAEAQSLRDRYWQSVRDQGVMVDGKVFVDKAPLTTLWQPLISRLFPDAKILFAIRDPRDVVLSCFRHAFIVNAMSGAFSDLEETAALYDGVMKLAALYREILPLPVHRHRHEDLIEDFEGEVRAICDFMGIDWSPAMADFVATANQRDIRTPSKDQVRRGLNRAGMGQWKRYERQMASVLPVLQPWVKAYGYEE
jgi:tetratricopeptide (TPR) repeat protein